VDLPAPEAPGTTNTMGMYLLNVLHLLAQPLDVALEVTTSRAMAAGPTCCRWWPPGPLLGQGVSRFPQAPRAARRGLGHVAAQRCGSSATSGGPPCGRPPGRVGRPPAPARPSRALLDDASRRVSARPGRRLQPPRRGLDRRQRQEVSLPGARPRRAASGRGRRGRTRRGRARRVAARRRTALSSTTSSAPGDARCREPDLARQVVLGLDPRSSPTGPPTAGEATPPSLPRPGPRPAATARPRPRWTGTASRRTSGSGAWRRRGRCGDMVEDGPRPGRR
jgi:hypothetical protein